MTQQLKKYVNGSDSDPDSEVSERERNRIEKSCVVKANLDTPEDSGLFLY
jgi:hypothetical protein